MLTSEKAKLGAAGVGGEGRNETKHRCKYFDQNSDHVLSSFRLSGPILNFTSTHAVGGGPHYRGGGFYDSHFKDEETECQRG